MYYTVTQLRIFRNFMTIGAFFPLKSPAGTRRPSAFLFKENNLSQIAGGLEPFSKIGGKWQITLGRNKFLNSHELLWQTHEFVLPCSQHLVGMG